MKKKDKQLKCIYCKKPIEWGLECSECGARHDRIILGEEET